MGENELKLARVDLVFDNLEMIALLKERGMAISLVHCSKDLETIKDIEQKIIELKKK